MSELLAKGKPFPVFQSDEEAERFVDEADLSKYDFSDFKAVRFTFADGGGHVDLEMPKAKIDAVDDAAQKRGISRDDFIRQAIDKALLEPAE